MDYNIMNKEVTVVFRGGPSPIRGKVIDGDSHSIILDGKPVGVHGATEINVIPWSGVAYIRVHPDAIDQ